MMSTLNPKLRPYFEMLPIEAKNIILESNTDIDTLDDLLQCVETLLHGAEG